MLGLAKRAKKRENRETEKKNMAPFLGALGQSKRTNRWSRTNEPRTIQEAADAIILHITKMERTLESALSKDKFHIKKVDDLGKLVKLAESVYEHFARAMDAQASFFSLVSNWFTRNRHGEEHKESKSPDSRDAGEEGTESNPHGIAVTEYPLVAHGEIRAETLVAVEKMEVILALYLRLFNGFIRSILGTDRTLVFGATKEHDDIPGESPKIFEQAESIAKILDEAKSNLGEIIDLKQVMSAYTNHEEKKEREKAMQLAQFVLGSYDKTFRGKAVSFLGKRNLIKEMKEYAEQAERSYNDDTHASGSSMKEEPKAAAKRQTEIDNKTNGEIAEMDHFFKTVRITVRAMEIKTKIHNLVARFAATTLAEAKLSLYGDFLTILEKEVKPALSDIVYVFNVAERNFELRSKLQSLTTESKEWIKKTSELLNKLMNDSTLRKEKEVESQPDLTDDSETHEAKRKLSDLDARFRKIELELRVLKDKMNHEVGSASSLFGSAFGRYVHRAAKLSFRVPYRAWIA